MQDYRQEVEHARAIALPAIRSFVETQLSKKYGGSWAANLRDRLKNTGLPRTRPQLDLSQALRAMDVFWPDLFSRHFSPDPKTVHSLVHEAIAIRNAHAHDRQFSLEDAERALDTFARLCRAIRAAMPAKQIADRRHALLAKSLSETPPKSEPTQSPQPAPSAPRQFYRTAPDKKPAQAERQPITKENTLACYELGKNVYLKRTTRSYAAEVMAEQGMKQASAFFLISAAEEMLLGKTYKRALSQMSTRIFLEQIEKDFGNGGLKTALDSLDGHIQYKLEATNDPCVGQKKILAEFKKRLT